LSSCPSPTRTHPRVFVQHQSPYRIIRPGVRLTPTPHWRRCVLCASRLSLRGTNAPSYGPSLGPCCRVLTPEYKGPLRHRNACTKRVLLPPRTKAATRMPASCDPTSDKPLFLSEGRPFSFRTMDVFFPLVSDHRSTRVVSRRPDMRDAIPMAPSQYRHPRGSLVRGHTRSFLWCYSRSFPLCTLVGPYLNRTAIPGRLFSGPAPPQSVPGPAHYHHSDFNRFDRPQHRTARNNPLTTRAPMFFSCVFCSFQPSGLFPPLMLCFPLPGGPAPFTIPFS